MSLELTKTEHDRLKHHLTNAEHRAKVHPFAYSEEYISRFDGVFVGGTPAWKWRTLDRWIEFAHDRGLPCHVGRVGKFRDIIRAREAGADSIDSSTIPQANKQGVYGQYAGFKRLEAVRAQAVLI
jgi:hypothetical protein